MLWEASQIPEEEQGAGMEPYVSLLTSEGHIFDLVHKLSINSQPTAQSYLFTEEVIYFCSPSNLYLFILLYIFLQKRGSNSGQRWRLETSGQAGSESSPSGREFRVSRACGMGPASVHYSVLGVFNCSCATVIILVICL